jgi:ribose/xylose/arabinose/galactoside ABC-type transport system permease subunit
VRRDRPDRLLLVAGCVLAAFGVVLLLDRTGTIDLSFGSMAPMAFGVVGAVLLATGLTRRE